MSDIEEPAATEDELVVDPGAVLPPAVEVQDDDSTPEPDQDPEVEDDS